MNDTAIAEALLLVFFTPEELAELTPGEIQLMASVMGEELPDLPQTKALQQSQRAYARQILFAITEIEIGPAEMTNTQRGKQHHR